MKKARSRDCKNSYINYSTGTIHCHKKCGGTCTPESCTEYRREGKNNDDSNSRRLDRLERG